MLLRDNNVTPPVMKKWIPAGVILGLKISDSDKDIIIRSSKMAGITHVYESYINDKYKLEYKKIIS